MIDWEIGELPLIAAVFVLAGVVKGATGMGLPTVAMGMLGALMSPVAAASLMIIPSFVTNVWQLAAGPSFGALARRLWPMMLAVVAATLAASSFLTSLPATWTTAALGAALAIYAAFTLLARQLSVPPRAESWLGPAIGAATGLVTGATGVFVMPAVPYLQALGLERDDLVQALGLSFTVSTVALAAGLVLGGAFDLGNVGLSTLAILPALAGMWIGTRIRRRVAPATFRKWFLLSLLILGLELASRILR